MWTSRKDPFYNYDAEEAEQKKEEAEQEIAKSNAGKAYINRVIFHPHFKNISYDQLVTMEPTLETGAIIIRPSRQVRKISFGLSTLNMITLLAYLVESA